MQQKLADLKVKVAGINQQPIYLRVGLVEQAVSDLLDLMGDVIAELVGEAAPAEPPTPAAPEAGGANG